MFGNPHIPPGLKKAIRHSDVESAELSRSDPDLLVLGACQVYVNLQRGTSVYGNKNGTV